jgi:hypothetical protein
MVWTIRACAVTLTAVVMVTVAAAPASARESAASLEKKCREAVGKEEPEGAGGRSHVSRLKVQRFSDCLMGMPH